MTYNIDDIMSVLTESTIDDLFTFSSIFIEDGNADEKNDKKNNLIKKVSGVYINAVNKSSDYIAKKAIPKPKDNADENIVSEYNRKVNKAKTYIKLGEILTVQAIAWIIPGPIDLLVGGAVLSGMAQSTDPSDQAVAAIFNKLKGKAKQLKDKLKVYTDRLKGNPVTQNDVTEYNALTAQGLNIAKEMEAAKDRIKKEKPKTSKTITESVLINKFDTLLLNESGELVDNACDILQVIIEKTDYTQYDIFDVVEHYLNMII